MKYYSYEKKVRSRLEGQKEQQEERGRRRFGMKLPEVGRGCCLTTGRNTLASLVYRSSFPLILIAASWDREGKEETPSEMNGAGDQNGERIWMRSSQSGSACECRMAYLLGRKRAEGGKRSGKEKGKERKEKKRKDGVNAVSNERNKGPPAQQRTDGREGKRFPRGNVVTIIRQTSKSWAIRSEGAFRGRAPSARCFLANDASVMQARLCLHFLWWPRMFAKTLQDIGDQ